MSVQVAFSVATNWLQANYGPGGAGYNPFEEP